MVIDTHAHLDFHQFDEDRDEVIKRAIDAGVERIVCCGCDTESSKRCIDLAKQYDLIDATVGIHPSDADQWNDEVANNFVVQSALSEVVAIGEIGLDYYRMRHSEDMQKKAFREQLALAKEVGLPVIIHTRDSARDVYDLLIESGLERVTLHCFNESLEFAEKAWARGWKLGFGGTITYPKNEELRKVVAAAPEGLFVLETDCPFLPPQSHRGERNEPAFITEVAAVVSDIRRYQE